MVGEKNVAAKQRKTALWKDVRRAIAHSKGRFISIMLLMALGSFALVGLFVAGPDMRATGTAYFNEYSLADLTVVSDYGLDADDVAAIDKTSGTTAIEYGYFKDVTLDGTTNALRVMSTPEQISQLELVDGRMPAKTGEIAVDTNVGEDYAIGSTITVSEKANALNDKTCLRDTTYTVVGHVHTPEIISIVNMGQSTAGTGSLKGYGVVVDDEFDSEVYMTARLTFEDTAEKDPYSNEYRDLVAAHKAEVEENTAGRAAGRLATVKADAQASIDDGQAEVDDAKQQLADAKATLDDAASQIAEAHQTISDSEAELADAEQQLADGQATLDSTWGQLAAAKLQLDEAEDTLASSKSKLADGKTALDDGYQALAAAQTQYNQKAQELADGKTALVEAKATLDANQTAYDEKAAQLEASREAYEAAKTQLETLQAQLAQVEQAIAGYEAAVKADPANAEAQAALAKYQGMKTQLEDGITQCQEGITAFEANEQSLLAAKEQLDAGWASYNEKAATAEQGEKSLAAAKAQIDESGALLAAKQAEYDQGTAAYNEGLATYKSGRTSYYENLATWKEAQETLMEKYGEYDDGVAKLAEAKATLAEKESEYNDGLAEYNDALPEAQQKIADGEADLDTARAKLAKLAMPDFSVSSRRETLGSDAYRTYSSVAQIVDSLARVFPVLLYLVAAFVTLSTMTRMVDEERINAGTLKALGYHDGDVALKFVLYGSLAGGLGAVLGIILGHTLMPYICYSAYGTKFTLPPIKLCFYPAITVVALVLAGLCSVLPAALAVRRELGEKPAALLLPKPPSGGSKILLEHIKPVWSRMSFTHKVTARNLFRYKQRMFMTILGVAGAACMLVAGFGVQHSIQVMAQKQFGVILKYDMIVAQTSTATDEQLVKLDELLAGDAVSSQVPLYYESVSLVAGDNGDTQDITLLVPQDDGDLDEYLDLHDRKTQETLGLARDGAVISERLANLLGVGVGDTVTFAAADGTERQVTVSGVCEMYMGHFMVMSREAYESVYGCDFDANASMVKLADSTLSSVEEHAAEFMRLDAVKSVVQNTALQSQVDTVVTSLNKIMGILIVVASMLAVVIMYNLTNINVSERMRELSTIKVLGFHSNETTMYIYRETIILTVLGLLAGYGLGVALHEYILNVVPPDNVMFNPEVAPIEFIVPLIVIGAITVVLYFVELRRLSTVDMLEALKSVE